MVQEDRFQVVIIGGGLAGLSAAAHLAERGITPLVLEAASVWPGGRLSGGYPDTFEYAGKTWTFTPDHGVHALWGNYDNMRAMLDRFVQVELRVSPGEAWINRWGREVRSVEAGNPIRSSWIPAPFHYLQLLLRPKFWSTINPLDFLSLPGFLVSIFWTVGFDPIKERTPLDGLMLKEYFRGWTPNLRATFYGLARNLLAAPSETISVSAFIAAMRFYTMLRRDAWVMQFLPGNTHDHLIQPLIDSIERMDGMVLNGVTAQSLQRDSDGWRIVTEDARRGMRSILTEHIILAVEPPAAERLLKHHKDTATAIQTHDLQFPGAIRNAAVRLWYDHQPETDANAGMFTGDFEIDNFFWLHRIHDEFAEWSAAGGSAVEVHMYGSERFLDQPDPNLLILAVNEIQRAFPELKGHFVHGVVRGNSRTQPVFRIPTENNLHVETPWENIYACGDWIGHETPAFWMERSAITSIAVANHVLAAYGKQPWPIIPPKRPELLARLLGGFVRLLRFLFRPVFLLLRAIRQRQRRS